MANPPFNLKDWRGPDELVHDGRWNGYDTPPTGNANYAWILHMVSKLSENGVTQVRGEIGRTIILNQKSAA